MDGDTIFILNFPAYSAANVETHMLRAPFAAAAQEPAIIGSSPIIAGSCAAAANGALNMCVSTLAAEYAGKLRINVVSPSIIENSVDHYGMLFDGFEPTSNESIIHAYRRTISAPITGRVMSLTRAL